MHIFFYLVDNSKIVELQIYPINWITTNVIIGTGKKAKSFGNNKIHKTSSSL